MSSIKDMVEYVVKELADQSEAIEVSETLGETTVLIEIDAADEDKGRLIGRRGRTVNAIRDIARVHAGKFGKKVEFEILQGVSTLSLIPQILSLVSKLVGEKTQTLIKRAQLKELGVSKCADSWYVCLRYTAN